jgi:hypothetical protein
LKRCVDEVDVCGGGGNSGQVKYDLRPMLCEKTPDMRSVGKIVNRPRDEIGRCSADAGNAGDVGTLTMKMPA